MKTQFLQCFFFFYNRVLVLGVVKQLCQRLGTLKTVRRNKSVGNNENRVSYKPRPLSKSVRRSPATLHETIITIVIENTAFHSVRAYHFGFRRHFSTERKTIRRRWHCGVQKRNACGISRYNLSRSNAVRTVANWYFCRSVSTIGPHAARGDFRSKPTNRFGLTVAR